jgi:hypothetical protein
LLDSQSRSARVAATAGGNPYTPLNAAQAGHAAHLS